MSERGQSTVEFALCLPFVVLVAAVLVQLGAIAVDRGRIWHAAREAARVAAVDPDTAEIRRAAVSAGVAPLDVSVEPEAADRTQGDPVTVTVRHSPGARLPLLGRFLDDFTLEAQATMRIETP